MRRLAFVITVRGVGHVVAAVPRLRNQDAKWLATFTDKYEAENYARELNEIAATFMPPKRTRKG